MITITLFHYLALSVILFSLGIYGLASKRNAVRMLMSVELILNAANINLIAFTAYLFPNNFVGWTFTLFIIALAAAEVAIGLGIFLSLYQIYGTANLDEIKKIREGGEEGQK